MKTKVLLFFILLSGFLSANPVDSTVTKKIIAANYFINNQN